MLLENPVFLALTGLFIIILIVGILISNKANPMVAMVLIPVTVAVIVGFDVAQIIGFMNDGLTKVFKVAVMFIFAILYFGVMQDAGLFDPFVRKMIQITGGNVVIVAVSTAAIGIIAQLDGAGATTFLITVPAMLPLYKALQMNKYLMLFLISISAGIVNMIPWGGPLGRVAAVTGQDVVQLWLPLIPIQISGCILILLFAYVLGHREKRLTQAKIKTQQINTSNTLNIDEFVDNLAIEQNKLRAPIIANLRSNPAMIWINLCLSVSILILMMASIVPPQYAFMIGLAIALPINYPLVQHQAQCIKNHASNALMMATIILAASVFLGILDKSGMLTAIATSAVKILPDIILQYVHIIVGVFGVFFDLTTSTDAYYFALLPVVENIASTQSIPTTSTAYAMLIGNIVGTFVSPFSPALWLGLGLADANIGAHLRYSFVMVWIFSCILLLISVVIGVVQI